ncbi:MAG TPA: hypothetical protein VGF07_11660 [Stellaceae bacterium]|jgi:hypothetical protein
MKTPLAATLAAAATAAMALLSTPVHASCTQIIYAERAFSTGASTTIYGRTTSTSTIIWLGTTGNPTLANLIFAAVAQRNRVQISGNATTCGTAGTLRTVGTVTSIIQQP